MRESIERMGRGCLGTGSVPSQGRWNSRARESMTVGRREEEQRQKSGRGLPPASSQAGTDTPSSPRNAAEGELDEDLEIKENYPAGE